MSVDAELSFDCGSDLPNNMLYPVGSRGMRREEWRKVRRDTKGWVGAVCEFRRGHERWLREGDMEFFDERNGHRSVKDKKWLRVRILD